MKSIYPKITALSLVFMLLLSPAVSFAKNKGEGKDREDRVEQNKDNRGQSSKENRKESRQCFKAFGHLIAKGYIKNKGEVEFPADCFLPFGIKKKFGGMGTSTDTVAPVITNVAATPNATRAVITWQTNENSDSTVFSNTSPNFSLTASSTKTVSKSERVKNHRVALEGLTASTTYYFVVSSKDASGNVSTSSEISFRTHSLPSDTTSPIISNVSYMPGTTTVMFSWNTNENSTSRVYYSTTSPLNLNSTSTENVFDGSFKLNHLIGVSGLTASTTYYVAVESLDQSGNKTTSPSFTVVTQ